MTATQVARIMGCSREQAMKTLLMNAKGLEDMAKRGSEYCQKRGYTVSGLLEKATQYRINATM